jgi:hypothetical protein
MAQVLFYAQWVHRPVRQLRIELTDKGTFQAVQFHLPRGRLYGNLDHFY